MFSSFFVFFFRDTVKNYFREISIIQRILRDNIILMVGCITSCVRRVIYSIFYCMFRLHSRCNRLSLVASTGTYTTADKNKQARAWQDYWFCLGSLINSAGLKINTQYSWYLSPHPTSFLVVCIFLLASVISSSYSIVNIFQRNLSFYFRQAQ